MTLPIKSAIFGGAEYSNRQLGVSLWFTHTMLKRTFKEVIVKKELLQKLKEKLVAMEKYVQAREIIEEAVLTNADEVLAHLGFRVQWKGLDPNTATIALQ